MTAARRCRSAAIAWAPASARSGSSWTSIERSLTIGVVGRRTPASRLRARPRARAVLAELAHDRAVGGVAGDENARAAQEGRAAARRERQTHRGVELRALAATRRAPARDGDRRRSARAPRSRCGCRRACARRASCDRVGRVDGSHPASAADLRESVTQSASPRRAVENAANGALLHCAPGKPVPQANQALAQSTGVSFATLSASHFMPWRPKLTCARASSPLPSSVTIDALAELVVEHALPGAQAVARRRCGGDRRRPRARPRPAPTIERQPRAARPGRAGTRARSPSRSPGCAA